MEITFSALEYLKGANQGNTLAGMALAFGLGDGSIPYVRDTEQEAVTIARKMVEWRDSRWDDREAIIFLNEVDGRDYLVLGNLGPGPAKITVADAEYRSWLPDASPPSSDLPVSRSPSQRFFLTDEPSDSGSGSGGIGSAERFPAQSRPAQPNVSLAALKGLIAENKRKLAAGDGSREYSQCLAWTLWHSRTAQTSYSLETGAILSGQPAGTRAVAQQETIDTNLLFYGPDNAAGDYPGHLIWYEGPAAHLVEEEYPGYVVTKRPLPAGEYRVFFMTRPQGMVLCDGYPANIKGKWESAFTVTAPVGTLAESFFDPATSSAAFVGTTTVGTISWEADTVTADLTLEIPANAKLDFIALDGTVVLSLAVANATSAAGVLSWEVTPQPWAGGDQLMLRVH